MEFKGTRGKWIIDSKNNVIDYLGDEITICPEWRTTSKANALLISKAPEILKELVNEVEILKAMGLGDTERCKRKERLIKEATEL